MDIRILYEFIKECGVTREHRKTLPPKATSHPASICLFRGTWIYDLPRQHSATVFLIGKASVYFAETFFLVLFSAVIQTKLAPFSMQEPFLYLKTKYDLHIKLPFTILGNGNLLDICWYKEFLRYDNSLWLS